jgi:hypothetical protein
MKATDLTNNSFSKKQITALPAGQLLFLLGLVGFGVPWILATIEQAAFNACLLLVSVSIVGLFLCRNMQIKLNDPALKVLGYFWLVKLVLLLFLLYAGWMPQLDPASSSWGYDPQRFYMQAKELIDNNWIPDFLSLNYTGILFYYGASYYLFGFNPVIPALINAFVTLIASLYLVRVGYEVKAHREANDWILACVLLLPELVWFDVMTSRETLMAGLLLFAMLTAGRYLARISLISLVKVFSIVSLSVLAIVAVRTSMLVPVFIAIGLMVIVIKHHNNAMNAQRAIIVISVVALLIIMPIVTKYIIGYDFNFQEALQTAFSAKDNVALGPDLILGWSENSIGMLLMPEGVLQSVLFLPARMILYLLAPLPKILVPINDLVAGSFLAWQNLMTLMSSLINIFTIPYALASLVHSIKIRKENAAPLVFHIPYWITFAAIAGGNLIVHERYRVMASLLLWGCAWLGWTTCPKNLINKMSFLWYGLLALSALFYLFFKFGLL